MHLPFVWWHFAGGDNEGPWFTPDILVNVHRSNDEAIVGIVREVLSVCKEIFFT